jgi:hypothetical protein
MGMQRTLRPWSGLEATYQGVATTTPILFTPDGAARDPLAGQPGYSPNLVAALPVAMGSSIHLWLPDIATLEAPPSPYRWIAIWRFRSVFDYRQTRGPFHGTRQSPGAPDTSLPPPTARLIKPAAYQGVVYQQPEPVGAMPGVAARSVGNFYAEDIAPIVGRVDAPLLPGGTKGDVQQGVLNPGVAGDPARMPTAKVHELQVLGDEFILAVWRPVTEAAPTWDFTVLPPATDVLMSQFFGTGSGAAIPGLGVYAFAGTET